MGHELAWKAKRDKADRDKQDMQNSETFESRSYWHVRPRAGIGHFSTARSDARYVISGRESETSQLQPNLSMIDVLACQDEKWRLIDVLACEVESCRHIHDWRIDMYCKCERLRLVAR